MVFMTFQSIRTFKRHRLTDSKKIDMMAQIY